MRIIFAVLLAVGFTASVVRAEESYLGVGGGILLPIQNEIMGEQPLFTAINERSLDKNLKLDIECDATEYDTSPRTNYNVFDLRVFGAVKVMPDKPLIKPYLLAGGGFAGKEAFEPYAAALLGLDLVGGAGFRLEMAKKFYFFAEWKIQVLFWNSPTAVDSPLTGGILFAI